MSTYERRSFSVELRTEVDGDDAGKLVGYAAVFNDPTVLFDDFTEVVRKGAFSKTLKESDVRALWNHDDNFVLGRTKSGTLKLSEDDHGLRVEITPPEAQWAKDLAASIKRGDVDQMSFGFQVMKDSLNREENGGTLRELLEVRLFDVSPVTFPAYQTTEISARDARQADLAELRERANALHAETTADEPVPADHSRMAAFRRRLQLMEIS